jgi:hypothetical protein
MEIGIKTGRGIGGEGLLNIRDLHSWLECHQTSRLEENWWRLLRERAERSRGKGHAENIKAFRPPIIGSMTCK